VTPIICGDADYLRNKIPFVSAAVRHQNQVHQAGDAVYLLNNIKDFQVSLFPGHLERHSGHVSHFDKFKDLMFPRLSSRPSPTVLVNSFPLDTQFRIHNKRHYCSSSCLTFSTTLLRANPVQGLTVFLAAVLSAVTAHGLNSSDAQACPEMMTVIWNPVSGQAACWGLPGCCPSTAP
jgi:hypothetical protein